MNVKWTIAIGAIALIAIAVWWSRGEPPSVTVVAVERGPVEATVANTRAGTVKACQRSRLAMPIGGVVERQLVREGDRVERDQLLLELWNRDRLAEVQQAEAAAAAAVQERERSCVQAQFNERELKRKRRLLERDMTSAEDVDRAETAASTQRFACVAAKAQVQVSEAQLALRRAVYERTQLRAPFAGVVAEVNGELGEYITPSPPGIPTPPAVDLIDDSCLYVTAPIDEVDARHLEPGLPVRISLDAYRGREFAGSVTRVAPYVLDLEKQARTVDIDVAFAERPKDVALLVGYSADVVVILASRDNALRIPTEALVGDAHVWIVDGDGRARRRAVTTGLSNWSYTEVQEGLAEGDRVIGNPDAAGLSEGAAVAVADD